MTIWPNPLPPYDGTLTVEQTPFPPKRYMIFEVPLLSVDLVWNQYHHCETKYFYYSGFYYWKWLDRLRSSSQSFKDIVTSLK